MSKFYGLETVQPMRQIKSRYFKNTKCNNCGKVGHMYRNCLVFEMAEDGESDTES